MDGDDESENDSPHLSSGRRRRSRSGAGPRVGVVRRKPRNHGPFGWFRQSFYNPRSPLITLVVLAGGFALIAILLFLFTRTPPQLPGGLNGGTSPEPPPTLKL